MVKFSTKFLILLILKLSYTRASIIEAHKNIHVAVPIFFRLMDDQFFAINRS